MSSRTLFTLGLVLLPSVTLAQTPRAFSTTPVNVAHLDPSAVQEALTRADDATYNGRAGDARRIYKQLIEDQRAAGQFAGTALWRLALNYLYGDDAWHAALTLDELAAESNRFGDPASELRASFESAVIWQQLKRPELVATRVERSKALLQSPVIPEAQKAEVRQRMQSGE